MSTCHLIPAGLQLRTQVRGHASQRPALPARPFQKRARPVVVPCLRVNQPRLAAGQASTLPGTAEEKGTPGDSPRAGWWGPVRYVFNLGTQVRRFFKTHNGQRLKLLAALALFVGYTLLMLFAPDSFPVRTRR